MKKLCSVYIGFDVREFRAFAVARNSISCRTEMGFRWYALDLVELRRARLYWRPTEKRDGKLWDAISGAPMATEFAISRFLTPILARERHENWALFVDADVMARTDLAELFALADDHYAVMCVKHRFDPPEGVKMDGQAQTRYARKNWSSVMLFNCDHSANRALTVDLINTLPGRDLHRFCWLDDEEIGALDPKWNWLAGHSDPSIDPAIVHFTDGTPDMPGYENAPYADEWRRELSGDNSRSI